MSIASQATQQKLPYCYDDVFDGLVYVIPNVGMSIVSQDKVIGRITASVGMSLLSWGENLSIVVEKLDENLTAVGIESSLKIGANITGAHRHQKNFDTIISALSQWLQRNKTSHNSNRTCPFCAESIKVEAIICRYCNRDVPKIATEPTRQVSELETFWASLNESQKESYEKLAKMSLEERKKSCFACTGSSADQDCNFCNSREFNLTKYLNAKHEYFF